ncbi:MAG: hypothetical protein ABI130_02230 [Leifsonia sp.]
MREYSGEKDGQTVAAEEFIVSRSGFLTNRPSPTSAWSPLVDVGPTYPHHPLEPTKARPPAVVDDDFVKKKE